jgi:hypothetical protein
MSSEEEKIQLNQAIHALEEFVKILVKEYPLVFKNGTGSLKINPSTQQPTFGYEVSLQIMKTK